MSYLKGFTQAMVSLGTEAERSPAGCLALLAIAFTSGAAAWMHPALGLIALGLWCFVLAVGKILADEEGSTVT